MAHRKAGGTAKNLTDSNPKYLGTKLYAGETTKVGSIIIRQRGSVLLSGEGTKMGKDHTIFASKVGKVEFGSTRKTGFNGQTKKFKVVKVK